ncbi:23S rRNA (adenine(2503)-C(2))-methyltransferase RlmN [Cloacibacillus sp. An23]|uniref:23S rRNA (adenine(2503)-C(2))-methyltransferase RlmN n=1 Tax=Cloacibacillus sp. An23 TaxID=1965591 RepID=UPI000B372092|nr:23S rRNA (adenine(2503)-C(2))-methyltransferase RlmN [Cloacibacillus sp. An23]OUO93518.1 23S rRNA (adenine(2503)-C(2))-methyltransferase [Cloacibacillus sp. An23]
MNEKIYAPDMDSGEWKEYTEKELGEPSYRAGQICQWIWQKRADDTEEMTNLSKALREKLAEKLDFAFPQLVREQKSSDGTRKFLWRLRDGESVESVLMKQGDRLTACISTQVGCPLQCTFCATGLSGFVRNLSAGEIAGQVAAIEKKIGREINNVVYMGMGEPFLNTEAVLKSIRMLNDPKMRNLGIRHITVSTSGVIPGIRALADSGLGVRLAVSLHAADGELRGMLMPVNHSYPVEELREALVEYQETTGDRITIEYALFGGVNDSVERARELVRYLRGIHVYVNLIPFNAVDGRYAKPEAEDVLRFKSVLQTAGFECEIRAEQGADIDAACGQLRRKEEGGADAPLERGSFSAPRNIMAEERAAARSSKTAAKPKRRQFPQKEEKRGSSDSRGEEGTGRGRFGAGKNGAERRSYGAGDDKSRGFSKNGGERETFKRRRENAEPQERYRSGKMKEARPTYRGGGEERTLDGGGARGERKFREAGAKSPARTKRAPAPQDGPFAKFYRNSAKPKRGAKNAKKS